MNPELKKLLAAIVAGLNQVRGAISDQLTADQHQVIENAIQGVQNAETTDAANIASDESALAALADRVKVLEGAATGAAPDLSGLATEADLTALADRVTAIELARAQVSADADEIDATLSSTLSTGVSSSLSDVASTSISSSLSNIGSDASTSVSSSLSDTSTAVSSSLSATSGA